MRKPSRTSTVSTALQSQWVNRQVRAGLPRITTIAAVVVVARPAVVVVAADLAAAEARVNPQLDK